MTRHILQRTTAAFWDVMLSIFPVLLVKLWPEMFSSWLMLSGIPLLACRYQIARLAE